MQESDPTEVVIACMGAQTILQGSSRISTASESKVSNGVAKSMVLGDRVEDAAGEEEGCLGGLLI